MTKIEIETAALVLKVSRRDLLDRYLRRLNGLRRDAERYDGKPRPELDMVSEALMEIYRAGLYDGLSAARDEDEKKGLTNDERKSR